MRMIGALALAGLVAALSGCRHSADTAPGGSALPRPQTAQPAPADCMLGGPSAVEDSDLGLLERLRGGAVGADARVTAALLAGSLSNNAGDWERAYAFCALVPATAPANRRVEAAVCQNKAAVSMGPARTACADVLAGEWAADHSRIGLGFAAGE